MQIFLLFISVWSFFGAGFMLWVSEIGDLWNEFPKNKRRLLTFISGPFVWLFVGLDVFFDKWDKLIARLGIGEKVRGWFMK